MKYIDIALSFIYGPSMEKETPILESIKILDEETIKYINEHRIYTVYIQNADDNNYICVDLSMCTWNINITIDVYNTYYSTSRFSMRKNGNYLFIQIVPITKNLINIL
jgi:hypothetical protein